MGTHPIFESDFDCLTVLNSVQTMPSVCVKDVDQQEFVKAFAEFLKNSGKVKVPEWADIVKTATHKELAPYDPDWFYVRCASLARHLYMRGNAGVGAFRKVYGIPTPRCCPQPLPRRQRKPHPKGAPGPRSLQDPREVQLPWTSHHPSWTTRHGPSRRCPQQARC